MGFKMDHTIITITKRSAARYEIDGAIRALADHRNFIAAELLAGAAIDVIAGVARAAKIETLSTRFESRIRPEYVREFHKLIRKSYNFLKHSDRDKDTAIDRYRTDAAVWKVFTAVIDFECCWHRKTLPMLLYISWFFSRYPNVIEDEHRKLVDHFNATYGDVSGLSEDEALSTLRKVFEQYDFAGDIVEQRLSGGSHNIEL
jgi:hypothetical protein